MSENNVIDLKDSYRFLKDMMTTPIQATSKISENMQSSIAEANRNSLEVSSNPLDVGTQLDSLNDILNGITPAASANVYLGDQSASTSSESLTSNANELNAKMLAFNNEFKKLKSEQRHDTTLLRR